MHTSEAEKLFLEAERWRRVIDKLTRGYKLSFCQKIQARISWDWYKAHKMLKKTNREIMALADQVSDAEMADFLTEQKV